MCLQNICCKLPSPFANQLIGQFESAPVQAGCAFRRVKESKRFILFEPEVLSLLSLSLTSPVWITRAMITSRWQPFHCELKKTKRQEATLSSRGPLHTLPGCLAADGDQINEFSFIWSIHSPNERPKWFQWTDRGNFLKLDRKWKQVAKRPLSLSWTSTWTASSHRHFGMTLKMTLKMAFKWLLKSLYNSTPALYLFAFDCLFD